MAAPPPPLKCSTRKRARCGAKKTLKLLSELPMPESFPKGITDEAELARCGQKNIELKDDDKELSLSALTAESMIRQFLYPTVTMKCTLESKDKTSSVMYHPIIECLSVLRGLATYAETLAPSNASGLFQEDQENENGEKVTGGWIHFTQLPAKKVEYFASFGTTQRSQFASRLGEIMRAGAETNVNIFNSRDRTLGYIFGFWLAKLYNRKGIPDEDLPSELCQAKQHFVALYGCQYERATVSLD